MSQQPSLFAFGWLKRKADATGEELAEAGKARAAQEKHLCGVGDRIGAHEIARDRLDRPGSRTDPLKIFDKERGETRVCRVSQGGETAVSRAFWMSPTHY